MKKNKLIIFCIVVLFSSSLYARLNPFKPTQTYIEEQNKLMNIDKNVVKNSIERTIKIIPQDDKIKKKVIVKLDLNQKPAEEIILKDEKCIDTIKKTEVIKKVTIYKYHLLPFIKIDIKNDIMEIRTKYKFKRYFTLKDENKLVFDYIGKKRFYTKREILSSHNDFNKIIIGAHPEDYYFRVVIQTKEKVNNYKINMKNKKSITIQYIKKNKGK